MNAPSMIEVLTLCSARSRLALLGYEGAARRASFV
jgi:hypothetical protein